MTDANTSTVPAVEVSDEDFEAVAGAALEAASIGDMDEARALDKLARKIKAVLSRDQQATSVPEQLPVDLLNAGKTALARERRPMQPARASSV